MLGCKRSEVLLFKFIISNDYNKIIDFLKLGVLKIDIKSLNKPTTIIIADNVALVL